jgi:hypothetical protein
LVQKVNEVNWHEANRIVQKHYTDIDYVALIEREQKPVEFTPFDQNLLDRLRSNFPGSEGEEYMLGRGFNKETLEHFEIGYSEKKRCVIVPMHTDTGLPIGFVARSVTGKRFLNSKGLPKSKTAWNMHRAKKTGATGIVVESSFDAMRVHQAGYPNTFALLGGSLSAIQKNQIERYFSTIVIATDNDPLQFNKGLCGKCGGACKGHNPGRELGEKIEEKLRRKILWAATGPEIYPHGAKDMGDLTDEEIRNVLTHAVNGFEYHMWTG